MNNKNIDVLLLSEIYLNLVYTDIINKELLNQCKPFITTEIELIPIIDIITSYIINLSKTKPRNEVVTICKDVLNKVSSNLCLIDIEYYVCKILSKIYSGEEKIKALEECISKLSNTSNVYYQVEDRAALLSLYLLNTEKYYDKMIALDDEIQPYIEKRNQLERDES